MKRALVALTLLLGCAHPSATENSMPDNADPIRDVITSLIHELDAKHWDALPPLFTDPVETDYTSLFGGEVQRQPATALVSTWQTVLSPLDVTQHVLGPIAVVTDANRATAQCHVRGYHIRDGLPGGSEWMVAGHYVFELVQHDGRWQIARMTLRASYQTGNRQLLQEAAAARPAS